MRPMQLPSVLMLSGDNMEGELTGISESESKIVLRGSFSTEPCTDDIFHAPYDLTVVDDTDESLVIANQPRKSSRKTADNSFHSPFNDAHSERNWSSGLCECSGQSRSCLALCCCWPVYRYSLATRLGETPFMPLIPCAAFALRVKIRALFGIKGSILKDFLTTLCCEPCAVCQMTREMDNIGL
ncbi:placenta-specific gene 8 protein-like isoform X1 [Biomphalaria glabrata]|uniref:Placenta-specific gene 8 protein-like isoform X1 n=2 Tax=Biomphalaria glabrata TaxID=6526 RepID=A0A9W2YQM7_BIOGL|nr:placenta-specific gene 8 protein-like isoform X1 [Biomphalaria glabrata]